MLDDFEKRTFSAPLASGHEVTHDVYTKGDAAATVVVIQELPGIGPETISLAETLHQQGFRVVLPHLFGPLGKISFGGNLLRVFCMRKEFHLFEKNQSSPVVDWLKALCRDIKAESDNTTIGVIGMCLTGNFAISLVADESVLAGVASQPSMPFFGAESLHMSGQEINQARQHLSQHGPMLAMRFKQDKLCTGAKFAALQRTFNDDRERIKFIELPGKGHSVLTLDLIKGGEPAQRALQEVIDYFSRLLKTA
ncbi:MAG: hypothetical protein GXP16_00195 [Gammaproteobacteria bacterium]|nr:hypothetical protein [Gammaproteobacteria bacterium]